MIHNNISYSAFYYIHICEKKSQKITPVLHVMHFDVFYSIICPFKINSHNPLIKLHKSQMDKWIKRGHLREFPGGPVVRTLVLSHRSGK